MIGYLTLDRVGDSNRYETARDSHGGHYQIIGHPGGVPREYRAEYWDMNGGIRILGTFRSLREARARIMEEWS